jgi:SOS response regulatory protein OraA/RecX
MHLKLTKIFEQDKNSLILLDHIPRGILPDRILLSFFPYPFDGEITEKQAAELIELLDSRAREQLMKYVADREHSSAQCREYLKRKHYHHSLIDSLIAEFVQKRFIDDARYTELLINSLQERGKSKRAIISKLKEARLPELLWATLLNNLFNPARNRDNLAEQVLKLRTRFRELPISKQKEKIFSSLFRKGYDADEIQDAWQTTK